MKKLLALILACAMVLSLAACGNSGSAAADGTDTGDTAAEDAADDTTEETGSADGDLPTISLRLWGAEEDQTLLAELVEGFKAEYAEYANFDIQIGTESESSAKDTVLTDIEAAADVYAFASDQLNDLVNAGALQPIDENMSQALEAYAGKTLDDVKAANVEASVEAASKDGTMYAFPMGAGNNYFLYYDASVVSEEQAQSWDGLLEAAAAAGKQVGMTLNSGWYNASFFLGAGFTVGLNDDGSTNIDWNGTSASGISGVDVVKGMINIASNNAFMPITDGDISNQIASGALCAVISGTWDASIAQTAFGDGYAATKLPTFTCAGEQIQMGCYSGFKLIGVNAYSQNAGWATLLAEYLTNEEAQIARFNARQLAPTNLVAAADEAVTSDVANAASAAQDEFGAIQNVGTNYWDPTATFGELIAQGELSADDDAGIQAALDTLVEGVTAPVA